MASDADVIHRFHSALVDEIRRNAPEYLSRPFTVAEIYQSLVPYRTHRDRIGVELNGDYEAALLRLLGGEDELMKLESEAARSRVQRELESSNPNTGVYREFAAVNVRLNPDTLGDEPGEEAEDSAEIPAKKAAKSKEISAAPAAPSPKPQARAKASARPRSEPDVPARGSAPTECPECDSGLPDRETLRFCPFCGANVFIMPCTECGEVLERNWTFCIACGAQTDD